MAKEIGGSSDKVLDLRVARWRHDPFITEMLEIIEKLHSCSEEEREVVWASGCMGTTGGLEFLPFLLSLYSLAEKVA